jgi:DDE superfamily endonuclease
VLTILFLSETYAGSTHDKRMADATPYPLPVGSRLLQDLGFLAFTLDQVEIIMPTRKPRGRALTRAQRAANRRIARRRVRIEHVNSSVKVRFVGQKPNRRIDLEDWPHVWSNTTTRHENLSPVSVEFRPPLVRG